MWRGRREDAAKGRRDNLPSPSLHHGRLHGLWLSSSHFFIYKIFILFLAAPSDILVPWPGIEPVPPALVTWSLKHWTTREVPLATLLSFSLSVSPLSVPHMDCSYSHETMLSPRFSLTSYLFSCSLPSDSPEPDSPEPVQCRSAFYSWPPAAISPSSSIWTAFLSLIHTSHFTP